MIVMIRKVYRMRLGMIMLILMMGLLMPSCSKTGSNTSTDVDYASSYQNDLPVIPDEKRLVAYTSHKAEVYEPLIREFEERTGIWVDLKQGGTKTMLERIRNEYEFGGVDIMFGGGVETLNSYRDCFEPYEAGESGYLTEKLKSDDASWTPFTELPIVFIYNTKIVSEEEAPSGWNEIFDEKWKGKISFADPFSSGTSYTILSALIQMKTADTLQTEDTAADTDSAGGGSEEDRISAAEKALIQSFIRQLDGYLATGSGQVLEDVADGSRAVGITLEETALRWIADGEHIGMIYPKDGVIAVPDGCAIVKNAPNIENARLFVDFMISRDVQLYMVENVYRRTVRKDIENPDYYRDIELADFDIERSGSDEERILSLWREYELY